MGEPNECDTGEWMWDGSCSECGALLDCSDDDPPESPREAVCLTCDADLSHDEGFALGCIVGAAIVAWGDAMREREEAKRRERDWEDRRLEEDMGG